MLSRLVGSLEYSRSLDRLEELVSRCSTEELQVIDSIVSEWDRFVVRTRDAPQQASAGPTAKPQVTEHRGLAWVMALARIELAAMHSVTLLDGSRDVWRLPTTYGRQEFTELVRHDTAAALASLQQAPGYVQLKQGTAGRPNKHETQTGCQRLLMLEAFLNASGTTGEAASRTNITFPMTLRQVQHLRAILLRTTR